MSGAAIIIIRQNRWMRRFEELGALSPDTAVPPGEIGRTYSWLFQRMVSKGVFLATPDGKLFMDIHKAEQFRSARRTRALVLLVVAVMIAVLILVFAR